LSKRLLSLASHKLVHVYVPPNTNSNFWALLHPQHHCNARGNAAHQRGHFLHLCEHSAASQSFVLDARITESASIVLTEQEAM
jgi:hypothetical protein